MEDMVKKLTALKGAFEADEGFKAAFGEAVKAGDIEKAIRLAAEKGIELTPADLAPADAVDLDGRELDLEELKAVAGGDWEDILRGVGCIALAMMSAFFG